MERITTSSNTQSNNDFELLFIGNELLIGKVLNTNSQWLTQNITGLGGYCTRITVIRDDLKEMQTTIQEILRRVPQFLIISGGLGPTYDDMTVKGLSKALNTPLQINKEAYEWIAQKYKELFKKKQTTEPDMTPARTKMARLPTTSKPLPNPLGTAPAVHITKEVTDIICLPGVPGELKAIFESSVKNIIKAKLGIQLFLETGFIVKDVGESVLAPLIKKAVKKYSPYIYVKSHPKLGTPDVTVEMHLSTTSRIQRKDLDKQSLQKLLQEAHQDLAQQITTIGGRILNLPILKE